MQRRVADRLAGLGGLLAFSVDEFAQCVVVSDDAPRLDRAGINADDCGHRTSAPVTAARNSPIVIMPSPKQAPP